MGNTILTTRDRNIIKFIEQYNSLTINLCHKIFIPSVSGYKIAQRRLNKMVNRGYLKVGETDTGENIYYIDKKLTYHDLLIISFYAELIKCGVNNISFEKSKPWLNGKIISDGFFRYEYGGYIYYNILEVCLTHKKIPIDNYEELFESGEAHRMCENTFPRVIIMDDVEHVDSKYYYSDFFKIIQIDFNLNDIPKIFID